MSTMTAAELIQRLSQFPPESVIYGSGDFMGEAALGLILPTGDYTEHLWRSDGY